MPVVILRTFLNPQKGSPCCLFEISEKMEDENTA